MTQQFYTRIRGKVSGPVDLTELHRQIKRGTLSRIHEISRDGKSWNRAGEHEDLFPARAVDSPAVPASEATPVGPAHNPVVPPPAAAAVNRQELFYEINGQAFGPLPITVVESMAINGAVPAEAMVWSQTDGTKLPARDHPLLKSITFSDSGVAAATSSGAIKPARFMSISGMMLVLVFLSIVAAGVYEANRLTAGSDNTKKPAPAPVAAPVVSPTPAAPPAVPRSARPPDVAPPDVAPPGAAPVTVSPPSPHGSPPSTPEHP